jgi:hypothetical protein
MPTAEEARTFPFFLKSAGTFMARMTVAAKFGQKASKKAVIFYGA